MDQTTITIIICAGIILLLCVLLAIATFSSDKFLEVYKELSKKTTSSAYTISSFFSIVNTKYLQQKIKVVPINEVGGDFYNSKKKIIGLNTNGQTSLASFAVVAHELGHAYQDIAEQKLRSFHNLRLSGMIIGKLFLPIIIATIALLFFIENYILVLIGGGLLLLIIVLLAIIIKAKTISIEKDASKRGLELLNEFLPDSEVKECKKLLDSARLTYWGDLIKLLLGWSGLTSKTKMFK